MHVFFSGIGGTGIGPLALIAKQAGYEVSGSDQQDSKYIQYLRQHGVNQIVIGQSKEQIAALHAQQPIDWLVHSSAIPPDNPELVFAQANNVKTSKRAGFLNQILKDKNLKMIAVAGTHGKTTTTAMIVWLFKQLGLPVSYSLGAKISFGGMGEYSPGSQYFVYEADEFDRNFLEFRPYISLITGVTWDHHEVYPKREDYQQAFRDFIAQSERTILWQREADYLNLRPADNLFILGNKEPNLASIRLRGKFNREDALLAVRAIEKASTQPFDVLVHVINQFPGLQRRMEQILPGLYSDYAHTPEKIRGAMSVATEMAQGKNVVVVYEPLTNRRQHYMADDYGDCFNGAAKVYWIPSYLAREDPAQRVIPPSELITKLTDPSIAEAKQRDDDLKQTIQKHLDQSDMVVCMAGGGGDSLDEWIRKEFKSV